MEACLEWKIIEFPSSRLMLTMSWNERVGSLCVEGKKILKWKIDMRLSEAFHATWDFKSTVQGSGEIEEEEEED